MKLPEKWQMVVEQIGEYLVQWSSCWKWKMCLLFLLKKQRKIITTTKKTNNNKKKKTKGTFWLIQCLHLVSMWSLSFLPFLIFIFTLFSFSFCVCVCVSEHAYVLSCPTCLMVGLSYLTSSGDNLGALAFQFNLSFLSTNFSTHWVRHEAHRND